MDKEIIEVAITEIAKTLPGGITITGAQRSIRTLAVTNSPLSPHRILHYHLIYGCYAHRNDCYIFFRAGP